MKGINPEDRKKLFSNLLAAQGPFCQVCKKPGHTDPHDDPDNRLTLGHLVARAKGGRPNRSNMQLEHAKCNQRKGTDMVVKH